MAGSSTLYLIAYDIADDRRRGRVHKLLCAYGRWTQFSLFECFLTRLQRIELLARLHSLINAEQDSLRLYPLCGACVRGVETVGGPHPKSRPFFCSDPLRAPQQPPV